MWFDGLVLTSNGQSLPERLNLRLYHVGLILALAFLGLSFCRPLMDNVDLGWHVAQGRWMATHGAIYQRDVLNYPNSGHALINEYPLFQIVLFAAWNFGWWGLFLVTGCVYGLLIFTLLRAASSFTPAGSPLFLLTLVVMFLYFQLAFPLRPHLITYLGVGILGVFLLRHREAATWTEFWPVAVLQVAWTNCHSAFVLGPIMVGLFGAEMTIRHTLAERRIAWSTFRIWTFAFLFMLLACLVNPFGWARFYPPIYQGGLEEIRAYVGEMQPLTGTASMLIAVLTMLGALAVILSATRQRGGISYSFLLLALLLYVESLSVLKSWPVFGLFPALLVLSTGAFGKVRSSKPALAWCSLGGNLFIAVGLFVGLAMRVEPDSAVNIPVIWKEYNLGRRELPYSAVAWMRGHDIQGRLLHRCEDGGLLQEKGYDHGETFSDTGFGKYDEKLIRIVSMIGERPALLPLYAATYQPDFVLCNSVCFRWPYYLRQSGWRLIFYSPSGAVWTRPEIRPDLPTVTGEAMEASFSQDVRLHGRPADLLLFGRDLLALNSSGREDFVFSQLTSLPKDLHRVPWYWEAARILCFETPSFSLEHRERLVQEAETLHNDSLTAEFMAFTRAAAGDEEGARTFLVRTPAGNLDSHGNDLLLKIDTDEHRPEALTEAISSKGVDLRDGRHWEYLAQAEESAGNQEAAAAAWRKAILFYPDEAEIRQGATNFATKYRDEKLAGEIKQSLDLRD